MYDFHYNYVKSKYGGEAKLLFTDTDSLAYGIDIEDVYQYEVDKFDDSNIPEDHLSGIKSGVKKKAVGMFKDEASGEIIEEYVGLIP